MHYLVDESNRIIDVNDDWDATAAHAPGGAGSMRASIVGRPLEAFMVGDATKMFVRAALDAARHLNEPRVLPYRCDSTDEHRRFEMVITPQSGGRLRVEHRLLDAQPRKMKREPTPARALVGLRCSQCMRVCLHGSPAWREADIDPGMMWAQDVCPACARRLFETAPSA